MMKFCDEEFVNDKARFFSDIQLWPAYRRLDPKAWLNNFNQDEKPYAIVLLNFFCFLNSEMIDTLFYYALNNISNYYRKNPSGFTSWNSFCNSLYFTYVSGEISSPADSGYLFTRKVRDVCGINEFKILHHEQIFRMARELNGGVLVLVDDFVGSGNQICGCLHNRLHTESLLEFCQRNGVTIIYNPIVATVNGLQALNRYIPNLKILPVHVLDDRYSIFSSDSLCWTGEMQTKGIKIVEAASQRAGIPMVDREDTDYWKGYHELGLAICFDHCTPDATIPLFRWDLNNWIPLIRK